MSDVFTRISNALPTIHPGAIARGSAGPEPRTRRAVDVSNWTDPHNISVHYENKQFVQVKMLKFIWLRCHHHCFRTLSQVCLSVCL